MAGEDLDSTTLANPDEKTADGRAILSRTADHEGNLKYITVAPTADQTINGMLVRQQVLTPDGKLVASEVGPAKTGDKGPDGNRIVSQTLDANGQIKFFTTASASTDAMGDTNIDYAVFNAQTKELDRAQTAIAQKEYSDGRAQGYSWFAHEVDNGVRALANGTIYGTTWLGSGLYSVAKGRVTGQGWWDWHASPFTADNMAGVANAVVLDSFKPGTFQDHVKTRTEEEVARTNKLIADNDPGYIVGELADHALGFYSGYKAVTSIPTLVRGAGSLLSRAGNFFSSLRAVEKPAATTANNVVRSEAELAEGAVEASRKAAMNNGDGQIIVNGQDVTHMPVMRVAGIQHTTEDALANIKAYLQRFHTRDYVEKPAVPHELPENPVTMPSNTGAPPPRNTGSVPTVRTPPSGVAIREPDPALLNQFPHLYWRQTGISRPGELPMSTRQGPWSPRVQPTETEALTPNVEPATVTPTPATTPSMPAARTSVDAWNHNGVVQTTRGIWRRLFGVSAKVKFSSSAPDPITPFKMVNNVLKKIALVGAGALVGAHIFGDQINALMTKSGLYDPKAKAADPAPKPDPAPQRKDPPAAVAPASAPQLVAPPAPAQAQAPSSTDVTPTTPAPKPEAMPPKTAPATVAPPKHAAPLATDNGRDRPYASGEQEDAETAALNRQAFAAGPQTIPNPRATARPNYRQVAMSPAPTTVVPVTQVPANRNAFQPYYGSIKSSNSYVFISDEQRNVYDGANQIDWNNPVHAKKAWDRSYIAPDKVNG